MLNVPLRLEGQAVVDANDLPIRLETVIASYNQVMQQLVAAEQCLDEMAELIEQYKHAAQEAAEE